MIAPELDGALGRLDGALGRLERAVAERFSGEGRGDLDTELELMGDDRARLAAELDGVAARLARFETASGHVEARVDAAIGIVEEVLATLEGVESRPADPAGTGHDGRDGA